MYDHFMRPAVVALPLQQFTMPLLDTPVHALASETEL